MLDDMDSDADGDKDLVNPGLPYFFGGVRVCRDNNCTTFWLIREMIWILPQFLNLRQTMIVTL